MPLNPNNPLNRPITLSNLFCIIIILILLAGNIFFGVKYVNTQKILRQTQATVKTQQKDARVLVFTKFFIEKVLKADNEVNFETRLELENAVRNLEDEEILSQWQQFTESKTEADAQEQVKNLLGMLINKIIIVFQ